MEPPFGRRVAAAFPARRLGRLAAAFTCLFVVAIALAEEDDPTPSCDEAIQGALARLLEERAELVPLARRGRSGCPSSPELLAAVAGMTAEEARPHVRRLHPDCGPHLRQHVVWALERLQYGGENPAPGTLTLGDFAAERDRLTAVFTLAHRETGADYRQAGDVRPEEERRAGERLREVDERVAELQELRQGHAEQARPLRERLAVAEQALAREEEEVAERRAAVAAQEEAARRARARADEASIGMGIHVAAVGDGTWTFRHGGPAGTVPIFRTRGEAERGAQERIRRAEGTERAADEAQVELARRRRELAEAEAGRDVVARDVERIQGELAAADAACREQVGGGEEAPPEPEGDERFEVRELGPPLRATPIVEWEIEVVSSAGPTLEAAQRFEESASAVARAASVAGDVVDVVELLGAGVRVSTGSVQANDLVEVASAGIEMATGADIPINGLGPLDFLGLYFAVVEHGANVSGRVASVAGSMTGLSTAASYTVGTRRQPVTLQWKALWRIVGDEETCVERFLVVETGSVGPLQERTDPLVQMEARDREGTRDASEARARFLRRVYDEQAATVERLAAEQRRRMDRYRNRPPASPCPD